MSQDRGLAQTATLCDHCQPRIQLHGLAHTVLRSWTSLLST